MTIYGKNEFFLDLFVEGKSFVKSHDLLLSFSQDVTVVKRFGLKRRLIFWMVYYF